jgi:hypothetical protein
MNTSRNGVTKNEFSPLQKKSLQRFKKKVTEKMPDLRIAWALPYNDRIIELHLEDDKFSYRRSLRASKLAFEVAEETGITIIFR